MGFVRQRLFLLAKVALAALFVVLGPVTLFASSPLQAVKGGAVRALVIGIDTYGNPQSVAPLDGAVADARDIAGVLRAGGVDDIAVLLDHEATRSAVEKAITGLAQRAKPDDLVVVTFAGHGAREPERIKGSEPDGMDEVFLLWGFDTSGPGTLERIIDDEMNVWLGHIAQTGAQTLFITDSCFGGGLTKGVDPRGKGMKTRGMKRVDRPELVRSGTYYINPRQDQLAQAASIPASDNATDQFASLTFIAAVDDAHESPEVQIPGESTPRGAVSYAFARALEGVADREGDRDGVTTRRELFAYLRRNVQLLSANRQSPVTEPRTASSADIGLFRTPRSAPSKIDMIANKPSPPIQVVEAKVGGSVTRPDTGALQVAWDPRNGDVVDLLGSVIAYGVKRDALPAIVDRVAAVRELTRLALGRSAGMTVSPPDLDFRAEERFDVTIDAVYGRYLVLINIAGDGTVQYLFPDGNADPYMDRDALTFTLTAQPPFGADVMVAVLTDARRPALELDLKLLGEKRDPTSVVRAIERHLKPSDRLGLATYTTRPR